MKTIIIKLSGELFFSLTNQEKKDDKKYLYNIAKQLKELKKDYRVGIVIGAGNIFRGEQASKKLEIKITTAHNAGMIATIINGLLFHDLLTTQEIDSILFSAIHCPQIAEIIKQDKLDKALKENKILIFSGGTSNPFFTTDTTSVIRALQIGATEFWKGTKVEGIFTADPVEQKDAKLLKKLNYNQVIEKDLKFMDLTAITLAKQHNLKIRIFNIFEENSLIKASKDANFGSVIV
ncbi:UMP kinase [Candidatus Babeliales bacterium]|nr:UMP kinase [Candidatus Babeliales bacterium]